MSRPVVEKRSLTRRVSLEDHVQAALDLLHADHADETADRALAVVDGLPEGLRPKAMRLLREKLNERLGIRPAPASDKPSNTKRDRAEQAWARAGRAA